MSVQATRLLVLGVIRLRQPVHGYEIQRELNNWNADQWASLARPSVYNQLRSLSRAGFLTVDAIEQSRNRPSKTLYSITESGNLAFAELLKEVLWNRNPQPLDLLAALCFLPALTRDEAIAAIKDRVQIVTGFLDSFDEQMDVWFHADGRVNYVQEVFLLTQEAFRAELRWAEGFMERLQTGTYDLAHDSILP